MKRNLLVIACIVHLNAIGQIDDGSIAPDFTLVDWNEETHHLYSYLDNDKTVFVEVFAAHCPGCWEYHQTDRLKNMYNSYGPEGTNEIMVLALEHDEYNHEDDFYGIGEPWTTQGNWIDGTPYPIFDVEWPDRGVFDDYNVTFYPVIYKICPDRIVERVYTNETEDELYAKVQSCNPLSIDETHVSFNVFFDQNSKRVVVDHSIDITSLTIMNIQGQVLKSIHPLINSTIDVSEFRNGVYLFEFDTRSGSIVEKLCIY